MTTLHPLSSTGADQTPSGPTIRAGSGVPLRKVRTSSTTVSMTAGVPRTTETSRVRRLNASSGPVSSSWVARTAASRAGDVSGDGAATATGSDTRLIRVILAPLRAGVLSVCRGGRGIVNCDDAVQPADPAWRRAAHRVRWSRSAVEDASAAAST